VQVAQGGQVVPHHGDVCRSVCAVVLCELLDVPFQRVVSQHSSVTHLVENRKLRKTMIFVGVLLAVSFSYAQVPFNANNSLICDMSGTCRLDFVCHVSLLSSATFSKRYTSSSFNPNSVVIESPLSPNNQPHALVIDRPASCPRCSLHLLGFSRVDVRSNVTIGRSLLIRTPGAVNVSSIMFAQNITVEAGSMLLTTGARVSASGMGPANANANADTMLGPDGQLYGAGGGHSAGYGIKASSNAVLALTPACRVAIRPTWPTTIAAHRYLV